MNLPQSLAATVTRVCCVRHGETAWNAERRIQGHIDVGLNDIGRAQALAVGRALAGIRLGAVYASDLQRAWVTAEAIAEQQRLAPIPTAALRERRYGLFEQLTYDEAARLHPEAYRRFMARDEAFALPDGESLQDLERRVMRYVGEAVAQHPSENIALVTHGGVLDVLYRQATLLPLAAPRNFCIPNAGVSWLVWVDGECRLESWGDTSHLADLATARDEL